MRRASDLPRRPPRHSRLRASGRYLLIGAALLVLFIVVFGRAVARFYVDELWFGALGQSGVFWTTLRAKLTLFGIFFVAFAALAAINLAVADKLAPSRFPVNVHPYVERFHQTFGRRLRLYRFVIAGLIALLMAVPVTTQWQSWLLYRNSRSFNIPDAQFGVDVGFYVFELPFLSFVLDWLFFAVVLVAMLTFVTHVLNGAVVFASPIPTVGHAMKGHLAVLLAVLAVLKAADYWVRRYETTNAQRGFVQGPTYSVVHAQIPALLLLAFVALVTGGLYLSTLKTQSWRVPLVASAVWLVLAIVAGYVYPAVVQSLVVRPNQKEREAPYIANNVEATRQAMGLTMVNVRPVTFGTIGGSDVEADLQPVRSVRLLSPTESRSRFQQSQGNAAGLVIADLDIDRYDTGADGELEQVLIAARELDVSGAGNQSWQGRHLINTHGCNLVRAPASRVAPSGQPIFETVDVDRPQLYFSPSLSGWAVAGSEADEQGCGAQETGTYTGTSGVVLSSWLRRAAFSLAFMDYNLIGSGAIDSDSQMLWNRNVRDRVAKLAPFLTFDGDPYPVVVEGRILWVVDAYTSTSRYPSAEAVGDDVVLSDGSGIPRDANYIRNSVKAVVDAYDGSVELYVVDDQDPIIAAWSSAFPGLFTDGDEMPAELRDHLRYPEDLFRVQTTVYSKYQLEPENFFDRQGAWSVAQALNVAPRDVASTVAATATANDTAGDDEPEDLATEASNVRFVPYYTLFDDEFVLLRPFVPFSRDDSRTELQAYMTASSDGQLTVYQVAETLPPGPRSVASTMEADPQVSEQVTFFNQARGGTNVRFGDLQLVPIAGDDDTVGALWVRPFYVSAQQDTGSVTDYKYMIVSYGGRVAIDATISGALRQLFPTFGGDVGERADGVELEEVDLPSELGTETATGDAANATTGSSEPATTSPLGVDAGADEVLVRVDDLLAEADAALARGDLGTYQEKVDEAAALLSRYLDRSPTTTTAIATATVTTDAP